MIETVFFDGDQTLWDFHSLMRRALEATLQELRSQRPGSPADAVTVESMIADRDQVSAELRGPQGTMEAIRVAAFRRTLRRIGLPDPELADHLAQHYFEHRFGDVLLYDDVRPTLTLLAEDYQLGLLTNGNSYPERSGLAGFFDIVVLAQDHGVSKPDRRLYDVAARQARVPEAGLAMIGDSLDHDVAGAQAAGWFGLWLDRDGAAPTAGVRPDATLRTLRDAPVALAGLAAR